MPTANVPTITRRSSATSNTVGVASNVSRIGLFIHNDSATTQRICEGATATATAYTIILGPGEKYEAQQGEVYTGAVNFISDAATGTVHFVERT